MRRFEDLSKEEKNKVIGRIILFLGCQLAMNLLLFLMILIKWKESNLEYGK